MRMISRMFETAAGAILFALAISITVTLTAGLLRTADVLSRTGRISEMTEELP